MDRIGELRKLTDKAVPKGGFGGWGKRRRGCRQLRKEAGGRRPKGTVAAAARAAAISGKAEPLIKFHSRLPHQKIIIAPLRID